LKKSITKLFIIAGLALIICTGKADAQLGLGFCGTCVSLVFDPSVYSSTQAILGQATIIASSVTTPGGSGIYQSAAGYLDQLSATMGARVTGTIPTDFPGEEILPPDTMPIVQQDVADSLNVYNNAWTVADELEGNQDADDQALANIEQVNGSLGGGLGGAALLAAAQLIVESNIHVAQELQYNNELLSAEIKMHAFEHAENLNERARAHITETTAQNWGNTPQ
jgi:hypothetical protein